MVSAAVPGNGDTAVETLPAPLSGLVDRVVRGTRLWPSEKRDVRAELESHFREGLIELIDQGLEFEQAVKILGEEFGDPDLAARLIRRGKKRGRPMIWKVFVHTLVVTAIGAGGAGGYIGWLYGSKPNPTVDYVEIINAPVEAVPIEDRAWPVLKDVFLDFQLMPEALKESWKTESGQWQPGHEKWPLIEEWLQANRPLIPLIDKGANKRTWGFVYGTPESIEYMIERERRLGNEDIAHLTQPRDPMDPALLTMMLPSLRDVRGAARFLAMDARDHAARGDFAAAWGSLETAYRLGYLLYDTQTLIEQLVAAAITNLATQEMRALLYDHRDRLTPDEFAIVLDSSLMSSRPQELHWNVDGEILMFMDTVQYLFTDDGQGNGRLIPEQYAKILGFMEDSSDLLPDFFGPDAGLLAAVAVHADRRETVATYEEVWERMYEYLCLPLHDPRRALYLEPLEELRSDPIQKQRYGMLFLTLPDLGRADQLLREGAMNIVGAQTVVQLLAYRSDHGRFPASLGELVPTYAPLAVRDVYSGAPPRYFVTDRGDMMLYSLGRNLRDDGGSTEPAEDGSADILYWPAPRK
ncbi:MAG: hypothetical protein JSU68_10850 [Phycisphaerales bacterium]|nr:MAG: hypothetical protein JSU68_10850 [Phycisphaerales bacterium]